MEEKNSTTRSVTKTLGDDLILRNIKESDIDRLSEFFMRVFAEDEGIEPDARVGYWVQDVFRLDEDPARKRYGFIVENEENGQIASALLAIPQTWTYNGLLIPVGRPEPVATDKEYRNRGLVRTLFQEFHNSSEQQGDLMQGITGIPWFYRQFGYEMTVELGGSRSGFITQVELAEKEKPKGISVRPAQSDDATFLAELYKRSSYRYLLHCPLDEKWWEKEISRKHPKSMGKAEIFILQKTSGEPAGFFLASRELNDKGVFIRYIQIADGENWRDYMPHIICESWKFGESIKAETGGEFNRFIFGLGSEHPAYLAAAEYLPLQRRPYNWFMRVPDLAKFITHICPILENNLENSPLSGFNELIKISFYKKELHLDFENGKLVSAKNMPAGKWHKADVCFPDLTFLQLLLGHRSGSELLGMFVDCRIPEKYLPIMDALFPKKQSLILPDE